MKRKGRLLPVIKEPILPIAAVRQGYEALGVDGFYEQQAASYTNPHEPDVANLVKQAYELGWIGQCVLDLCCGSGEVTRALPSDDMVIEGSDPYTAALYHIRTGKPAHQLTFIEIAREGLPARYDTVICSFALHLCPHSLLAQVLWRIGEHCQTLLVVTPHKRPDCAGISGWQQTAVLQANRVRLIRYQQEILSLHSTRNRYD